MSMMTRIVVVLILVMGAIWTQWVGIHTAGSFPQPPASYVEDLYDAKTSDVVVEVFGSVSKIENNPSGEIMRQEFTLEFPGGHAVEVSHDTVKSPRIPLKSGDEVEVRGEYIWTERGGIIHMTHRSSDPERTSGWINHDGKSYE